ncbi:hypothetical protein H0O01_05355 [Candidatus Micrarchaeota archaeon]|nr:hypothetical protein [Candidatus Micrarchaeota archaeon]
MKHRAIHKTAKQKPTEKERFEKWLLRDGAVIGRNLERATRAPFDTDAKISVLSALRVPPQSQPALMALKALRDMAMEGSEHAREAFEKAARVWLGGPAAEGVNRQVLNGGILLVIDAAFRLDSPQLKRIVENAAITNPEVMFQLKLVKLGCEVR